MYAGSFAGVWRSRDAGETWSQLTWPQPTLAVQGEIPGALYAPHVFDLAASPADANLVLVSALDSQYADGRDGIYRTNDGGANWRSLGGFAPTAAAEINRPAQRNACGAIHVVFGAGEADDDVYVGTGETAFSNAGTLPDAQPGSSMGGIGILIAHGPATSGHPDDPWTREARSLIGRGVHRIAVEPGGTTVVAATSRLASSIILCNM